MRLIMLALACATYTTVQAQNITNTIEIDAAYCIYPYHRSLPNGYSGTGSAIKPTHFTQAAFATARYHISNKIALGLALGFEQSPRTSYYDYYITPGTPIGQSQVRYITVAPEVLRYYFRLPSVRVYSYLGAGFVFSTQYQDIFYPHYEKREETYLNPVFQFVPVGVSVGHKLSGFAEIGIGYKGIVNAGVSYRF